MSVPPPRAARAARIAGLYAILDRTVIATGSADPEASLDRALGEVLSGGCRVVQYRDKESDPGTVGARARRFASACRRAGALFIVNDRLDAAIDSGADGCHLGQGDMELSAARALAPPDLLIGISTHNVAEAARAERGGADYIGIGAVYPTTSKREAVPPRGPRLVAEVAAAVRIPAVAISGITLENVREVLRAGAAGFAVISALFGAPDVRGRAREFLRIWEEETRPR